MSFYTGSTTTALGDLTLNWVDDTLVAISFGKKPPEKFLNKHWPQAVWQKDDNKAQQTVKNWFDKTGTLNWQNVQTTPHKLYGTAFQQKVWTTLIKHAQKTNCTTLSYGALAALIGQPKAARAIGGAMNKNPLLLLMPCHLVVGANGALTGFAAGLDVKKKLLGV